MAERKMLFVDVRMTDGTVNSFSFSVDSPDVAGIEVNKVNVALGTIDKDDLARRAACAAAGHVVHASSLRRYTGTSIVHGMCQQCHERILLDAPDTFDRAAEQIRGALTRLLRHCGGADRSDIMVNVPVMVAHLNKEQKALDNARGNLATVRKILGME